MSGAILQFPSSPRTEIFEANEALKGAIRQMLGGACGIMHGQVDEADLGDFLRALDNAKMLALCLKGLKP